MSYSNFCYLAQWFTVFQRRKLLFYCWKYSFCLPLVSSCGPGSSVGIATGYGLDGPRIESRWGRDFPHLSRPALGPTHPPVQWVPGLSRGVKSIRGVTLSPHILPVPRSWKSRAIPLLRLWAIRHVQSLSACTRVHFTFTFSLFRPGAAAPSPPSYATAY